jgi:hypothetical protein
MYIRPSLLVLLALNTCANVDSFAPLLHTSKTYQYSSTSTTTTTTLDAKAKAKKKTTTSKTGGFGTVVEKKSSQKAKDDGDSAAFPPLEPKVRATLQPSTEEDRNQVKDLSNEIYDRLGQIYGLRDFNFPAGWFDDENDEIAKDKAKDVPVSFDDLISGSDSASTADFGDLLKPMVKAKVASTGGVDDLIAIAGATGGSKPSVQSGSSLFSETTSALKKLSSSQELSFEELQVIENLPPFTKFRVLHVDPMVLSVDDFLTPEACDEYVDFCANPKKRTSNNDMPMMSRSKTVGKDSISKAQRTSTTWYHHFKSVPELMAKASRLMGLRNIDRWEEPQTVRYQQSEKFTWHLDALAPSDGLNDNGGQRVATLLVYLTDVGENNGGSTLFRDLGGGSEGEYLKVQPKKGSALVFFPAAGGVKNTPFDIRTLHAGEALASDAPNDKWIAQLWLRKNNRYTPSAPPGNSHSMATEAIEDFCKS